MKSISIIAALLTIVILGGCATSNYSVGNPFPSENVQKIVKGKTTSSELISLFGQPFTKSVISESEVKWTYTYASGTAKAQSFVLTTKVETTGTQKTLDVLVKNDLVVNYSYTENQNPYSSTTGY